MLSNVSKNNHLDSNHNVRENCFMSLSNGNGSNYHSIPERLRHYYFICSESLFVFIHLPKLLRWIFFAFVEKSVSCYLGSVFLLLPDPYLIDLTFL